MNSEEQSAQNKSPGIYSYYKFFDTYKIISQIERDKKTNKPSAEKTGANSEGLSDKDRELISNNFC